MPEVEKPPNKSDFGRTPYDAVIEIIRLLGHAGPYAVFLVIILYSIQQIVITNNEKMEAVNKARTDALEKNAADIAHLNEAIRNNASDFEKLRASQIDSVSRILELSKAITSTIVTNQSTLAEQRAELDKAKESAAEAKRAADSMNNEQKFLKEQLEKSQKQEWKAEETIDAARRILSFLGQETPLVAALADLSRRFETVGPEGMAREEDGNTYYGTFRIPGAEMGDFISFMDGREPQMAARLNETGGPVAAKQGSENFKAEWRSLSRDKVFDALQAAWIEETQYLPFLKDLGKALAHGKADLPLPFPAEKHSLALQAVLWSITVQEGRFSPEVRRAWSGLDTTESNDRQLICAIYAERDKIAQYRPKASPETATLLQARYRLERRTALLSLNSASENDQCPK